MKLRRWLFASLALALLAPAGAGAYRGGLSPPAPGTGEASPGRLLAHTPVPAVQSDQSQAFAILRTAPEGLPVSARAILQGPLPPAKTLWRLNFDLAQLAYGSEEHGKSIWVVPGRGWIELLELPSRNPHSISGAPATTIRALHEGVAFGDGAMGSPDPGDPEANDSDRWVGLVPGRIAAVRLGRHTVAHVENNVYVAEGRFTDLFEHLRLIRRGHLAHASVEATP